MARSNLVLVRGLVRTAADYRCRLLVLPEYFTIQLLTLGDVNLPMEQQIRKLADRCDEFFDLMGTLARDHDIHIVAGSTPVAARQDAVILVVPSYTDDRQGFLRVRYCAHARAIENQMFVIHAATVGALPLVPAVSLNYGQASILTPSDFPFARDGILAEGLPNQETMVIGELNLRVLRTSRFRGPVLPLRDNRNSAELVAETTVVRLSEEKPRSAGLSNKNRIVVRNTREEDFPGIRELAQLIYPNTAPWSDDQLRRHLELFPQGQFVAVDRNSGLIAGMCSGLIIDWNHDDDAMDWARFTDGGMFTTREPAPGGTLFAADVMVRPGLQGHGLGKRLYKRGRFGLAQQIGLRRILAGSRLRGYHRYADKMSAEDYVVEVVQGRLNDPTLSFQLAQGFHVLAVVAGCFVDDAESQGHAAVIEWLNPDVADPADHGQGEPRFRSEQTPTADG